MKWKLISFKKQSKSVKRDLQIFCRRPRLDVTLRDIGNKQIYRVTQEQKDDTTAGGVGGGGKRTKGEFNRTANHPAAVILSSLGVPFSRFVT